MICAIHQPNYLPYLGFFDKAATCDIFILYDTTQFRKNSYQNRNRLCSKDGWEWITIPVKHSFGQKICNVEINAPKKALKNNREKIKTLYGKAPFFNKYAEVFENIYTGEYKYIADLSCDFITALSKIIGLKTKFIRSSELPEIKSTGSEALIELCKSVKADVYLSGKSGKNYLEPDLFEKARIKIKYQNYNHPVYRQFNNKTFQQNMSVLDLIFNCGDKSFNIIKL